MNWGLLVLVLLTASCAQQANEPVKVGAILVLSGDAASWGEASRNSIDLAVAEANAGGGVNGREIQVIYEDTEGSAAKAVTAYAKLKDIDGVAAIIGPNWQAEVSAVAPLAAAESFPIITPSYAPLMNRPDPRNPLLIWLDPDVEAKRLARHVQQEGVQTVAVLGTEDSWERQVSHAFVSEFVALGGDVTHLELIQPESNDVRTSLIKLLRTRPDAIFVGSYFQFLNAVRVLDELGYEGEVYSIEVDEYLAGESRGFSDGVRFISLELYEDDFRERYRETYDVGTTLPAGQAYDSMNILIEALHESEKREDIIAYFRDFESYEGASGEIRITENHSTLMPTALYGIRDGGIVRIEGLE